MNEEIEPATRAQKRMFFGLANNLGYNKNEIKERAKAKFGLSSFSESTKSQLQWLIDQLVKNKEKTH